MRIILTKTEAQAKKAKQEIESGKSFASVAKSTSIDPTTKAKGGELKGVVKGQEEKALDEAIFSAKKGVLGGPVKTPFGYYIYEVTSYHARQRADAGAGGSAIKQQLTATQQQAALSKFVKEFRKKWDGQNGMSQRLYGARTARDTKNRRPKPRPRPQTSTPAQTTSTPATTTTK